MRCRKISQKRRRYEKETVLSLFHFVSCTTLTGAERCALIGQIHEGTQIGTKTNVSSTGGYVYSYNTPSYNPICKKPKTPEEATTVAELLPIAQEKQRKKNVERWVTYGGIIGGLLLLTALGAYR